MTEQQTAIFRLLVGAFILSASMLLGVLAAMIITEKREDQPPRFAQISECVMVGVSYDEFFSCAGRLPDIERTGGYDIRNNVMIRIYNLSDGNLELVFTPSDSLYSARLILADGRTRTLFP